MQAPYTGAYLPGNRVKLISGGSSYFGCLAELIRGAVHCIHLQVYILRDDYTGRLLADLLMAAAKKSVQVYVLVDGYASQELPQAFIDKLREAGVHFRFFEPLWRSKQFYFGRRLHHKVFCVDNQVALVGGINIADRYNSFPDIPAWLDKALLVEGPAVSHITAICQRFWTGGHSCSCPEQSGDFSMLPGEEPVSVRVRQNDWVKGKTEAWRTYFNFFHHARKEILIMCSYFIPGYQFQQQLVRAAQRGVAVSIVLAGPSDVPIAKYAERYLYRRMLERGIRIYEYQPTVLHAKICVVDGHYVTIGSYNLNNISAYASIELNADVRNRKFANEVAMEIKGIIKRDCTTITITHKPFERLKTLFNGGAYLLVRLMLHLSTFYFKRA